MGRGRKRKSETDEITDNGIGPVDAFVGARICARRRLLQMSQKQLAEKLGVTFQQVQKYEKGQNRIGAGRLYSIARILGVKINYFFDEVEFDALVKAVEKYPEVENNNMCSIGFFQDGDYEIKFDPIKGGEGTLLLKLYYSLPPKARKGMLMMLNGLRTPRDDLDDDE
ncbi:MAG: helix-turn-helix transcriptional regulator [Alphaproteobacteria bacterium]|nr:helix-turn-helix transcriptional regulator [Alphaproteobacteria bacterium]